MLCLDVFFMFMCVLVDVIDVSDVLSDDMCV